ncbi:GTPase Era [Porphyromonas levii]|uniref:GTPase Era n=1 Tax=Porphyromonas levii TaxID=28114 RepID=A0A4Y8WQ11_9PORP|nr:GTPase Era [Porphyromonas levii]MBR8703702.1 GTPase Era [Porphyromonas levii]MBR8713832.1 GTPase Era [Porphyromonas levii]MBR8715840.1 GTPase Era [Porphyromonas levii]MBR8728379.1 GTPase Era [Porphyromonas levii]MBR8732358.1 GTPase Era [Porphyromonas levii]
MYRSGFVNLVGNPNVGKSTLMNKLVGDKISIITNKAQTTRHRIIGIVNRPEIQIVYSDTPGVVEPAYKMQEQMLGFSKSALGDADILLYVTDVVEDPDKHEAFLAEVRTLDIPVMVLINKADLSDAEALEQLVATWKTLLPNALEVIPVAALHNAGIAYVQQRVEELLPESPPYFEEDAFTDRPARFFVSEIIREKIFLYYQKEVPYATEVVVESFKEGDDLIRIGATIFVEREGQKGILIGNKGAAIKKLGMMARQDIERFFDKKVFLELFVKVEKDWRSSERMLRSFGYKQD